MTTDPRRGDVVLVGFPFIAADQVQRKRRPAVVVQADRYNRGRDAVILAAITSTQRHRELPSKVFVARATPEGEAAGLRTDSVVDCQTLVTLPTSVVVAQLGRFPPQVMARIDTALADALGLPSGADGSAA
jgi:mRNA-degrading endonuclease toxin of MazEF toxin-antitoxin module